MTMLGVYQARSIEMRRGEITLVVLVYAGKDHVLSGSLSSTNYRWQAFPGFFAGDLNLSKVLV